MDSLPGFLERDTWLFSGSLWKRIERLHYLLPRNVSEFKMRLVEYQPVLLIQVFQFACFDDLQQDRGIPRLPVLRFLTRIPNTQQTATTNQAIARRRIPLPLF